MKKPSPMKNEYDRFLERSAKRLSVALVILFGLLFFFAAANAYGQDTIITQDTLYIKGPVVIIGQKGEKGDKGDQGIQGIPGVPGPPGVCNCDTIPPVQPPTLSVEWNVVDDPEIKGYRAWVLNAETRDTLVSQKVVDGDVVGDLTPGYDALSQYLKISYEVLYENGERVEPDLCQNGGSITYVTFCNKDNPEGFVYSDPYKDEITHRVITCTEMPWRPNPNSIIDSVAIRDVELRRVGVNVYTREFCQAVIEFGSYMNSDSLIYAGIKENSFNWQNHLLSFGNKPGDTLQPGRRYYFQAVVTDQQGQEFRSQLMTVTTLRQDTR